MARQEPAQPASQRVRPAPAERREGEPPPQEPPATPDDIRRFEELMEKYGWDHLREKP